jgi:hypothetical protein
MGQKSEQDYRECRGGSILASMTGAFSLSVKNLKDYQEDNVVRPDF